MERVKVLKSVNHRHQSVWRTWQAGREYDLDAALQEAALKGKTTYQHVDPAKRPTVASPARPEIKDALKHAKREQLLKLAAAKGLTVKKGERSSTLIERLLDLIEDIKELFQQ